MKKLVVLLLLAAHGVWAQEPTTPPSGARAVTLAFPPGYIVQQGESVTYSPAAVDAIVRSQTPEYLKAEAARMMPAPKDFVVGRINDTFSPALPVKMTGRVVETATRVQFKIDGGAIWHEATTILPTYPGYPKVWTWNIPEVYLNGVPHKVYARALNAAGNYLGPLDNAKFAAQFTFQIPKPPPPPGTPPVLVQPPGTIDCVTKTCDIVSDPIVGIPTPVPTKCRLYSGGFMLEEKAITAPYACSFTRNFVAGTYTLTAYYVTATGVVGPSNAVTFTSAVPVLQ